LSAYFQRTNHLTINPMHNQPIIECIPNFSEGRNVKVINAIAAAIRREKGVKLLHIDQGEAANRTVFTFAGVPEAVVEAAFQAIKVAGNLIDMRRQTGEHPRIGATDVCPLVPIANISMATVRQYALQLGERVGNRLGIPVYLYEKSAQTPNRKNLATIRSGEYEGLAKKMQQVDWQPDFGKKFNAKTGATVIGARDFLIAYNVNLDSPSAYIANQIAREIRESGKVVKKVSGEKVRIPGKCKFLKAIGWYIEEYRQAQVSINLTNYKITGIHHAFEACKAEAQSHQTTITGSELIGLIPKAALLAAGQFYYKKEKRTVSMEEEALLELAIQRLGLNDLAPFDYRKRVIEYLL
ncbi:MAG: glutamate formimidoyltransferase, partial [Bacteroidota bacterium]